jgi:hypothetical protein
VKSQASASPKACCDRRGKGREGRQADGIQQTDGKRGKSSTIGTIDEAGGRASANSECRREHANDNVGDLLLRSKKGEVERLGSRREPSNGEHSMRLRKRKPTATRVSEQLLKQSKDAKAMATASAGDNEGMSILQSYHDTTLISLL